MAEQTLDSYIVQLNFFKNMCKNPMTTRNDIELEWNNLLTLDDLIEDELSTMLLPPQTFSHFQKFQNYLLNKLYYILYPYQLHN